MFFVSQGDEELLKRLKGQKKRAFTTGYCHLSVRQSVVSSDVAEEAPQYPELFGYKTHDWHGAEYSYADERRLAGPVRQDARLMTLPTRIENGMLTYIYSK